MAVADVGRPLTWVAGDELFEFWKNHAKPRIGLLRGQPLVFGLRTSPANMRTSQPSGRRNLRRPWWSLNAIIDGPANRPLHLTAPGRARARPSRSVYCDSRVPQVSGRR
jgi:hypothetical protein